jgi:hypothetical protein
MKKEAFVLNIALICCVGLLISLHGQQLPTFDQGSKIKANGVDMRIDTYASVPCVVDWNEDGKKDLLVGCFFNGNVYLLLNSGSNSAPVFTTSTMLQAGGTVISVAYG